MIHFREPAKSGILQYPRELHVLRRCCGGKGGKPGMSQQKSWGAILMGFALCPVFTAATVNMW